MAAVLIRSTVRTFKRPAAAASAAYSTGGGGDCTCTSKKLEGKVALITGGASGLGKATADKFLHHGTRVVIADLDVETGIKATEELGSAAEFVRCDVTVEEDIAEAVGMTVERGMGPTSPASISELDMMEFERLTRINVFGVVYGIKHAAKFMIPAWSGCILCTSSIAVKGKEKKC